MTELVVRLLPMIILGAASPIPIAIVITLLMGDGGVRKAAAFTAGLLGCFAAIGMAALIAQGTDLADGSAGSRAVDRVTVAIGVVLMLLALKKWLGEPAATNEVPGYMRRAERLSVAGAVGFGLLIALVNLKQVVIFLAGLTQIAESSVGAIEGWIALALLTLGIQAGPLTGVAYASLAPERSAQTLAALRGWLIAHDRKLSIAIGLTIGAILVALGTTNP